ncbi:hypothetical protein UFOVP74_30 [uncultured Caudovirales phage]|uniref:Uncharacterized protein n=1 Tax=uncultured Caudovirales phage TaxID=2100421 RepID=A0A6J5KZU4_9CAUD|nr:hypothetical protein UFOVP74_30 [uncultured Caudovirales phage]
MKKVLIAFALVASCQAHAQKIDSCSYYRRRCDTLQHKLYMSNMKVEKCRRYVKICMKNRSQDKFLLGWIRRAVE